MGIFTVVKLPRAVGSLVLPGVFLLAAGSVQAATVTFTNINDSNSDPGVGFIIPADTFVGNTYDIDVSGFDAVAPSGGASSIFDTIAFKIVAPTGYYISSVSYSEAVQAIIQTPAAGDVGIASTSGSAVIDGTSYDLVGSAPLLWTSATHGAVLQTGLVSLSGQRTSLAMSITNSLSAIATGTASAEVRKGFDANGGTVPTTVQVTLGQFVVPLPPALWLMGSALFGLAVVGRRRKVRAFRDGSASSL